MGLSGRIMENERMISLDFSPKYFLITANHDQFFLAN